MFVRLGLALPGGAPALAKFHRALMISGFLGTVISLESARLRFDDSGYMAATLSVVGLLFLLAGAPMIAALITWRR